MKKISGIILSLLAASVISCTEPTTSSLCIARMKGRIVSTGPACAGIAIQVLEGLSDPQRVDSTWFDEYGDHSLIYKNVFTTYAYCSMPTEQDKLLTALETKEDFYFIFAPAENTPDIGFADCMACKPLVSLPRHSNAILIADRDCNDRGGE